MIFDKLSVFQEGVPKNIGTVTERVYKMEASTLTVFTDQGSSQLETLVEQISELEKYRVSDCLRIGGLESRLNAGADEVAIGEVILRSPEYLKAHTVVVQGGTSDFGVFVCVHNILPRIKQHIKGEKTMAEVMKHNKDLASLKISEDEAITVYTFSVVVSSLFAGKRTTKSDIAYLLTYGRWIDKSLQTSLGYDFEKMLDPVHCDIKLIIA